MSWRRSRTPGMVNQPVALAQALVNFWITLNEATSTIGDSYNVASITGNGTGDFTVTFLQAFAATQYAVIGSAQSATAANNTRVSFKGPNGAAGAGAFMPQTTSVRIGTYNASSGVFENCVRMSAAGIGLGGPVAPSYENQVTAWVQFDLSSTAPVIGQSVNIASLTDNGAGDTTVTFAVAYANANYCAVGMCGNTSDASSVGYNLNIKPSTTPTTTGINIFSTLGNQQAGRDVTKNSLLVLGRT